MKFTLNSLFVLTTATAVLVAMVSVAIRLSFDSDRGTVELLVAGGAVGLIAAIFGFAVGLMHARLALGSLIAAGIAFLVGATMGLGFLSDWKFASTIAAYCVTGGMAIVGVSVAIRWWSTSAATDTFTGLLERYERRREVVLAQLVDEPRSDSAAGSENTKSEARNSK